MIFRKWFAGRNKEPKVGALEKFTAGLEPGQKLFVIGDIHGQVELLRQLLGKIEFEKTAKQDGDTRLIFVGDYIDRGENSRDVLEHVMAVCMRHPKQVTALMGNHERMMLDFLNDPESKGKLWLKNGGLQTLASFGVGGVSETATGEALELARNSLRTAMPKGMEKWLSQRPLQYQSGNIHVVHAAADPELPMDQQTERVLLWGLSAFRNTSRQDGNWIVHGHTIVSPAAAENGIISIDTGAYATGALTAACIEDGKITFQSTRS